jgi:hypothetical protein
VQYSRPRDHFCDGFVPSVLTPDVPLLQGKLVQAPISTLQVATAAGGNAAGSGNVPMHRLDMPGQQLYALQAVSLVPATQSECRCFHKSSSKQLGQQRWIQSRGMDLPAWNCCQLLSC